jgi:hypothetical protein
VLKFVNPWVLLGVVILLGAATAGGFKLGSDHQVAKQAETKELIAEAADAFDGRVADHVGKIKPIHKTIQNNIEGTVRENTYYRDCVNEPSVQRLLDDARANRSPAEREAGVSP